MDEITDLDDEYEILRIKILDKQKQINEITEENKNLRRESTFSFD